MKTLAIFVLALTVALVGAPIMVLADDAVSTPSFSTSAPTISSQSTAQGNSDATVVTVAALNTVSSIALIAGLTICIGVVGPSIGQGLSVFATANGMARNPEAAGSLRVNMIIGLALIESLAIYALVISLLLIYAFPFSSSVTSLLGG
ncbi:MAG: ATP synthase F0 subunit C [Deltaproteobacteria bacterium]|jgi:F-type H+-transporting ATPase subunit c|nr:ATP synthase F0 subunit C [Deltaproteobacteria bacterium]